MQGIGDAAGRRTERVGDRVRARRRAAQGPALAWAVAARRAGAGGLDDAVADTVWASAGPAS